MQEQKILYLNIQRYKYMLAKDYNHTLNPKKLKLKKSIGNNFVVVETNGRMKISEGYCWDGPSGPAVDTPNFMRASLVHDALYQLMRENQLDNKKYRKYADKEMRRICRKDGMTFFRSWYTYIAVRWFGFEAADPNEIQMDQTLEAP